MAASVSKVTKPNPRCSALFILSLGMYTSMTYLQFQTLLTNQHGESLCFTVLPTEPHLTNIDLSAAKHEKTTGSSEGITSMTARPRRATHAMQLQRIKQGLPKLGEIVTHISLRCSAHQLANKNARPCISCSTALVSAGCIIGNKMPSAMQRHCSGGGRYRV